jgi:5-methylcytosine-specific restriction protein A
MAHLYKEKRTCECGFETFHRGYFSTHKSKCKLIIKEKEQQLEKKFNEEVDKKVELRFDMFQKLEVQFEEKLEQLEKKFEKKFEQMEKKYEETKNNRKRKDSGIKRTEPQRRKILKRQNWLCAGEACKASGKNEELQEYDIDHIIPRWLGGSDDDDNVQALCPLCHRRKTDKERILYLKMISNM